MGGMFVVHLPSPGGVGQAKEVKVRKLGECISGREKDMNNSVESESWYVGEQKVQDG